MIKKFRKKPVEVEAMKFDGTNHVEIYEWAKSHERKVFSYDPKTIIVFTLEGEMQAEIGDMIIKGVKGEFYPCKPDIFEMTYDDANSCKKATIPDNSDAFRQFLREQNINYTPAGSFTDIPVDIGVDLFDIGGKWADYKRTHQPA